jgi:glycosyltransferase involved in cell wall biosynthesis
VNGDRSPAVSVIVTAFNEEELVGAAIESILNQTQRDLELIVVDDGSTDGTATIVRGFAKDPRLRFLQQENRGLSAARNAGMAKARGALISFLDSDDLWLPTYLSRMQEVLAASPEAGFAYTDAWLLDERTQRFRRAGAMAENSPPANPPTDADAFLRLLMHANFIFVSTTVRRRALDAAGLFDETLTACEDYDLWIRVLAAGFGAVSSGERLAIKRDRDAAMSHQHRNMFVNLRRVCTGVAENAALPEATRAIARDRALRLGHELDLLGSRAGALRTAAARFRRLAGRARRRLRANRAWYADTPAEIRRAFPGEEWRS